MIFLCFSSKDRHSIVESFLYHLRNCGMETWYDRSKIVLGDERNYKNFNEGILQNKYSLIILSKNTIESVCANEEIDIIYKQYKTGKMTVFPVFYELKARDLPMKYKWMTSLVYKELKASDGTLGTCNHIVVKFLNDLIIAEKYKTIEDCTNMLNKAGEKYISTILSNYLQIDHQNYNAKISLVYCVYQYCTTKIAQIKPLVSLPFEHMFAINKLNLKIDSREVLILELSSVLLLNQLARMIQDKNDNLT